MRPHVLYQRTALEKPITVSKGNCKPGYAIWRFKPRVELKKLPWLGDARRHYAAKSLSTKSLILSQRMDIVGVFHQQWSFRPSRRLDGWPGDICDKRHALGDTGQWVHRKRVQGLAGFLEVPNSVSQVNTIESAVWEAAYHALGHGP